MQVLDRYLAAIARHLPQAEAADIIAELKDNLLSEIEEKEAVLGRRLTAKELDALLIGFGHPLAVAARYGKARYLIGPETYPFFVATLKVVFGILLSIAALGIAIAAFSGNAPVTRLVEEIARVWPAALTVFAIVTLVFAVIERVGKGRMELKWSPRQLARPRSQGRKPVQIVSEMAAGALAIAWWTGFVQFHALVPIPPFVHIHLAHVWSGVYWAVLAYWSAEVVIGALELALPGRLRLTAGLSAAKNLAGCIILLHILQAGHWIDVNATVPAYALAQMRHGFDEGMRIGMSVTLLVLAGKAVFDAWRALRGGQGGGVPAGTAALV